MRFRRKAREPRQIVVQHRGLEVTHKIVKMPDPRPVTIWLTINDEKGQQFRTVPVRPYGRESVMQSFPLAWITGNPADAGMQVRVDIGMDYQQ